MTGPIDARLDHVGVVVSSVSDAAREYVQLLGAVIEGPVIRDPIQKVDIQFLRLPDGTRVELIQPCSPDSPAKRALEKGGGINHLCFEVPDLQSAIDAAVASHAYPVCPPTPAPALGGRKVAFLVKKHIGLIEFVESAD